MYKVTKYPQGTFSWADCASTDTAATKAFYAALMDWETEDLPLPDGGFYTFYKKDGLTVAGMGGMPPGSEGVPSHWNNYVTVENTDTMMDKLKMLGGSVVAEPFDIFDSGRMLVAQDPTGAIISFWQPYNHIGASLVNTVGAMSWNELATKDVEKAKAFYGELLGWTFDTDANDYTTISNNGRLNGGIMEIKPEWGEMPPAWTPFFTVADLDVSLAKVKELGGRIYMDVIETPEIGRFATIAEPTGAACTLIQMAQPGQPWVE